MSVVGTDQQSVEAEAWVENATSQADLAEALIASIDHELCSISWSAATIAPSVIYIDATAPRDSPVTLVSNHAAVEVKDIAGPVRIQTAHGRVLVLNSSAGVVVEGGEGSHAAWRGAGGALSIHADLSVSVCCTARSFGAPVTATATGDVRLVVPLGFADEIVVAAREVARVHTRAPSAKVQIVVGHDLPAGAGPVRLVSTAGDVHVVESRNRKW